MLSVEPRPNAGSMAEASQLIFFITPKNSVSQTHEYFSHLFPSSFFSYCIRYPRRLSWSQYWLVVVFLHSFYRWPVATVTVGRFPTELSVQQLHRRQTNVYPEQKHWNNIMKINCLARLSSIRSCGSFARNELQFLLFLHFDDTLRYYYWYTILLDVHATRGVRMRVALFHYSYGGSAARWRYFYLILSATNLIVGSVLFDTKI